MLRCLNRRADDTEHKEALRTQPTKQAHNRTPRWREWTSQAAGAPTDGDSPARLVGYRRSHQERISHDNLSMVAVGVAFYSFLAIFPALAALQWKWLSWGAVVATLIWLAGSSLFSFYVANLGNYNKTYGSIGVVVILMTWFLLGAYSILLGAEINAEMEHQTAKDTTIDESEPLGQRGAYVADTVGYSAEEKEGAARH